ncbi:MULTISPECIES: hypothetical protein [unclassified Burkholderia]|uniref:hypothetical protein n=1 Tax=unclassified Burkholderia TaxID=2613784 RepID=UPI000F566F32|nr:MULTISPECIES: hypothetical protein [unclassified Burkholderia]
MNCKPPCMAVVIYADYEPAIGLVVEVLTESRINRDGGHEWIVVPPRAMGCWDADGNEVVLERIYCPDAWLRPVSGLPITGDVTDEVTA